VIKEEPMFAADGRLGRVVRKVAASAAFRKVAPKVLPPADRLLHKLSKGRLSLSQLLVPSMVLTTVGQKSGLSRETPLACVPSGNAWYVVGSNFGRKQHPAWTGNLMAHPDAYVAFAGQQTEVVAQLLSADEKALVWPELIATWPAFDDYAASSGRNIRVFRLLPI